MFEQKKQALVKATTSGSKVNAKNNLASPFINAGLKKSAETLSGNGSYIALNSQRVEKFKSI